jgi:hypothetical protein
MELNHYGDTILGVVATEAIPEGRFVLLTSHSQDVDFGSQKDLPGIKLPADPTEAARARYIVKFAQDNRPVPLLEGMPTIGNWALRYGWESDPNVPFDAKVYLTHPGMMGGVQTIASGSLANAFGEGVYTLASGQFIASETLGVGSALEVADATSDGTDAGKLKVLNAGTAVAEVLEYDATANRLTVRVF